MTRVIVFITLMFILPCKLKSQSIVDNFPLLYVNDSSKNIIKINTNNFYNSNAVNNNFL